MIFPLQIEFHNAPPANVVESRIRKELGEFEKFYNRLVSCRIDVETPEHPRRGSLKVRVDFGLPADDATAGAELQGLAGKKQAEHVEIQAKCKDAATAVHAALNIARRRLKDLTSYA